MFYNIQTSEANKARKEKKENTNHYSESVCRENFYPLITFNYTERIQILWLANYSIV